MHIHVWSLQKGLKKPKLKDGEYNEQHTRKRKDSSSQDNAPKTQKT
jgi:hypothetical protein